MIPSQQKKQDSAGRVVQPEDGVGKRGSGRIRKESRRIKERRRKESREENNIGL